MMVKKSTKAGGPFIKQSLSDFLTGGGWHRLLFMHILRGVVAWGPFLKASTMDIYVIEGLLPALQVFLSHLPKASPVCNVLELRVELLYSVLLDE
jgi:hypothetical protein